jgi:hypothetical protein
MAKSTFPKTIHVTREEAANEDPYLVAHEDGPPQLDETAPCAIYQLVEVGKIEVTRTFTKDNGK